MASSQATSTPFYKQGFFWLAVIAMLALIGRNMPPSDSAASPSPSPVYSAPLVAPSPAPAPATLSAPAETPPITNNNIVVLGADTADMPPVLNALPSPPAKPAPAITTPPPVAPEVPQQTGSKTSRPDCLEELAAHHRRVADWADMMRTGKQR